MTEYKCDKCNKVYKYEKALLNHKNKIHSNGETIYSEEKELNNPNKEIKKKINTKEQIKDSSFDCNCGKSYKTKWGLTRHKKKCDNQESVILPNTDPFKNFNVIFNDESNISTVNTKTTNNLIYLIGEDEKQGDMNYHLEMVKQSKGFIDFYSKYISNLDDYEAIMIINAIENVAGIYHMSSDKIIILTN
jgi:hypothetical protein